LTGVLHLALRQSQGHGVGPVLSSQLIEASPDILAHGPQRQVELFGNLLVGVALRDQGHHLALTI
jgi:hypothetical protein